jgi:AbrB family looped-hinge helix DNA binding protein
MKQTTVQIDHSGRVVLPKPLRERFRLRGGDTLAIAIKGDAIELRPAPAVGELTRVNGILVYTAPGAIADEDLVAHSRDQRLNDVMGQM